MLEKQLGEIRLEVGLHQGSALSPFLFIIIMDVISDDNVEDTPWSMLFADDLGTTIHQEGGCRTDVQVRFGRARDKCRELTAKLCDKKVLKKLNKSIR